MLPKIILLDYNQVANDFVVRLMGTAVTKQLGEQTGKSIKNFIKDTETIKRLMWCVEHKKPYYVENIFEKPDNERINYSSIVLPISNDGVNVNMLLISSNFY